MTVTLATKITILRILLVPVFVGFAIYYAESVRAGAAVEAYRYGAMAAFATASISDGIDGFIARKFHQESFLGRWLDPLADKALMLSAILVLSFTPWPYHFPLWFPILVISRDLSLIAGAILIKLVHGKVEIDPHWSGKIATIGQIAAISWVLLQWDHPTYIVAFAGLFTAISSIIYMRGFLRQIHPAESEPSA
ncbi:CDP-alcohol phosphatidyltransferase family protein [Sulfuriroseicoccus oceanibius]|uniref:CDP-diacylglycerol--glycerol-3-phosphate 3-phosphatidyltransferase n=1 Tax=Sulfuriroseicoccus oceanibius TaxID=2707525 RepID=A0A6B3LA57_9BACT|nr:CDP-alcohol phosphatidyltransferase family protein [Sulfuriroseicoccus oceanibius]QQL46141.1 CDP-alcohol phosphatidyltransferase family protein [Sulfuriroseicoccus oceanibius]